MVIGICLKSVFPFLSYNGKNKFQFYFKFLYKNLQRKIRI